MWCRLACPPSPERTLTSAVSRFPPEPRLISSTLRASAARAASDSGSGPKSPPALVKGREECQYQRRRARVAEDGDLYPRHGKAMLEAEFGLRLQRSGCKLATQRHRDELPHPVMKSPVSGHFSVAGRDLNPRLSGYEPPRLCTRMRPYSTETPTPSRFRPRPCI